MLCRSCALSLLGGVLELNAQNDPELFKMARVGLGCLGVVTELTLQAVPAQKLKEKTFVASVKEVCFAKGRVGLNLLTRSVSLPTPFQDFRVAVPVYRCFASAHDMTLQESSQHTA